MAIREDLVASAAQFLQDPSVASSSIENRISFLRSKNLTKEEIDVSLARVGAGPPPQASAPYPAASPGYPQQYPPAYPQHAWQPPPPMPSRDWRDWFIMATVAGGVTYGLYALGKRYVYPLIAPPTPERLEQDKKTIEEQFDKAFSLVEQLAKDTEKLKEAEEFRTQKLDAALLELESVMGDLKSASRRREEDSQRIRDEVQSLKDAIPKAMDNQKNLTDDRLKEINTELGSLKTLVSQRMNSASSPSPSTFPRTQSGYQASATVPKAATVESTTDVANESKVDSAETSGQSESASASRGQSRLLKGNAGARASIPAWQMAMAHKSNDAGASSSSTANGAESSSTGQQETTGASS